MSSKPEVSSGSDVIGFYVYGRAYGSTDGANTFPANWYDLKREYGRSGTDMRRHFVLGGSIVGPKGLRLNLFIVARPAVPFDITTGHDANDDRFVRPGRPSL